MKEIIKAVLQESQKEKLLERFKQMIEDSLRVDEYTFRDIKYGITYTLTDVVMHSKNPQYFPTSLKDGVLIFYVTPILGVVENTDGERYKLTTSAYTIGLYFRDRLRPIFAMGVNTIIVWVHFEDGHSQSVYLDKTKQL